MKATDFIVLAFKKRTHLFLRANLFVRLENNALLDSMPGGCKLQAGAVVKYLASYRVLGGNVNSVCR